MNLIINIDGGSRGNPGPAGAGVVIRDDRGRMVHEGAYFLGRQTNNAAEYMALIHALQRVAQEQTTSVLIHSDSELLVRQITGEYRVKSEKLQVLYEQVQKLLIRLGRWSIRHVPREHNQQADKLANLAMDRQATVVSDFDAAGQPVADDRSRKEPARPAEGTAKLPPAKPSAPAGLRGPRSVRISLAGENYPAVCPARDSSPATFRITASLPAGLCVHAAHALLPSLLAMLNTELTEFAGIPTMTVRCSRPQCAALFHLTPGTAENGSGRAE